ncbi:MAG: DHH family phosphoesterase [Planctomycetes bacterium]|nr:DHH family phosphoesterase [Planctomycetota bacterium]
MTTTLEKPSRVHELLEAFEGRRRVLVLSHNNPDPDSMGGGFGLRFLLEKRLGVSTTFAYRGDIFRAENLEMVRALGIGLVRLEDIDVARFDGFAMVDTQPGFGHTFVPPGVRLDAVVDHHIPPAKGAGPSVFRDVRTDVGATCSIVTGYLMDLGLDIPPRVATALLYGIRTDTADLSRNTSPLDERAYLHLMQRADRKALASIAQPSLPANYFKVFRKALNATRIHGKLAVCSLGTTENPEIVAEYADLLLRLEGTEWVVTGGLYKDTYYVSVRAKTYGRDAWSLLREVLDGEGSYGGHGTVGGASIPLEDDSPRTLRRLERRLYQRLLDALGEGQTPAKRLI